MGRGELVCGQFEHRFIPSGRYIQCISNVVVISRVLHYFYPNLRRFILSVATLWLVLRIILNIRGYVSEVSDIPPRTTSGNRNIVPVTVL